MLHGFFKKKKVITERFEQGNMTVFTGDSIMGLSAWGVMLGVFAMIFHSVAAAH